MKQRTRVKSELERQVDQLKADGYTVIDPERNAIKAILADLGKADLDARETERLCQTAKCVTLNGFVRYDLLPCGCSRVYRGLALGFERHPATITLKVGGIEGVKPCLKHKDLIGGIRWALA